MTDVSAARVKQLREMTGAGMMDCKRALVETAGDIEGAVDWLRKKGLAAAAKKSGRIAAEGLIGIHVAGRRGAMVEVNSETDFVSRNADFQAFARTLAGLAIDSGGDLDALLAMPYPADGRTVAEQLTHMIATIGENMQVRRVAVLDVPVGRIGFYVHNAQAPDLGKIGVLVGVRSDGDPEQLAALGKQLAMHVAAASPQFLSQDGGSGLARPRACRAHRAGARLRQAEAIIEKMVEGRLRRYYEETCLLEQVFVIDGETKVQAVVDATAKAVGAPVTITGFTRSPSAKALSARRRASPKRWRRRREPEATGRRERPGACPDRRGIAACC
jgi:elongation factor Ts